MNAKEWDRRGLEGLPLKLLLVALLISLSLPVVSSAMDDFRTNMEEAALGAEVTRVASSISDVYVAGEGNVRFIDVEVPVGDAAIEMGGEGIDALSVRAVVADRVVRTAYMDDPPIKVMTLNGGTMSIGESITIRLECLRCDGHLVVLAEASA